MGPSAVRLVSLVPCITDTLHALGIAHLLVGVTRYCPKTPGAQVVGGIHDVDLVAIGRLDPTCVLADPEENGERGMETLRQRFPVTSISVKTVSDAIRAINDIAAAAEVPELAWELTSNSPPAEAVLESKASVATLIWKSPWRTVGKGTYSDEVLDHVGLANVIAKTGYPETTLEELKTLAPDLLLLPSEPYKFSPRDERLLQEFMGSQTKVIQVDGTLLFWYGARTLTALDSWSRFVTQLINR